MAEHYFELAYDEDGYQYGGCHCGWESDPMPSIDDAADAYGDHRVIAAVEDYREDETDGL